MRTRYRIISEEGIYFITSTTVAWLPVFTRKPYFDILTESFSFCREHKALKLYAFVIPRQSFPLHPLRAESTVNYRRSQTVHGPSNYRPVAGRS
jgi:phosphoribosyl 1,2-cyclic phosphodiesterase